MLAVGVLLAVVTQGSILGAAAILAGLIVLVRADWIGQRLGGPSTAAPGVKVSKSLDRVSFWQLHAERRAPVVSANYTSNSHAEASRSFQADSATAARFGYFPTSQQWIQGQWGRGAFLVAVLLFIVLIGLLIFI
jgi:hypothetical protein